MDAFEVVLIGQNVHLLQLQAFREIDCRKIFLRARPREIGPRLRLTEHEELLDIVLDPVRWVKAAVHLLLELVDLCGQSADL